MRTVVGKLAAVALCATALTAISHSANASTVSLGSTALSQATPNPLYGGSLTQNNVINAPGSPATGSALFDSVNGLPSTTEWVQQTAATTSLSNYFVSWYFAGSESGYTVTFNTPTVGPAVTYTEHDNNNNIGGATLPGGYLYLGQTAGTSPTIDFTLSWLSGTKSISNGNTTAPGTTGVASLIFSYITPNYDPLSGLWNGTWELTHNAGSWFAFALNDTGGPDDNHDDYVGFAFVSDRPGNVPGLTPVPGALPLFSTVLGGGLAFSTWRKRRKNKGTAHLATV